MSESCDGKPPDTAAEGGGAQAQHVEAAYDDLVRLARIELSRHRRGHTLNTQALVNETYLKLVQNSMGSFQNRTHFVATAARAMRHVVIDYARMRLAERRGGGVQHLPLDELQDASSTIEEQARALLAMDRALEKLSLIDARLAQVVELRFFTGIDVKQTAELLGVSEPTIKRDTRAAKAFLKMELDTNDLVGF